jgi:hypothetical protein
MAPNPKGRRAMEKFSDTKCKITLHIEPNYFTGPVLNHLFELLCKRALTDIVTITVYHDEEATNIYLDKNGKAHIGDAP